MYRCNIYDACWRESYVRGQREFQLWPCTVVAFWPCREREFPNIVGRRVVRKHLAESQFNARLVAAQSIRETRHGNEPVINHAPFSRTTYDNPRRSYDGTKLKTPVVLVVVVVGGGQKGQDRNSIVLYGSDTARATLNPFEFSLSAGIRGSFQTSRIIDLSRGCTPLSLRTLRP